MSLKISGKLPSGKLKETIRRSPNYRNNSFQNLSPTPVKAEGISYWKMMKGVLKKSRSTKPSGTIVAVHTDLDTLSGDPVIIWFGHSSYLLKINGKTFLIDPVLSGSAAPFSFMIRAFAGSNYYTADKMPEIDYLILTHDHYDHLDYKTILRLKNKTRHFICSLGISAHLRYWGIPPEIITETDWWDEVNLEAGIKITAAPARHFSGRGIKRGQSLWSSFILSSPGHRIYLGGDSGYDTHFAEIGKRFGPFDLAILECGQYNDMWPLIHMKPEETVQAAIDLQAKCLMPVHWGKVDLSTHDWNEPTARAVAAGKQNNMPVTTPRIGEPVYVGREYPDKNWWG